MLHRPCHIRSNAENLVLHWTGHLEHRKGLRLALEALGQVKETPWRMVVSGAGPLESDCRRLTARLNLANRVTFQGIVPRTTLLRQFQSAHGFLFTSLRDSFGYVVMDAMSQGLPVIALDHQGVGSHLPESCACKIPVSSAETTRAALADAVRVWAGSEEVRRRMSLAAWSYAGSQTWAKRAESITSIYETVVADRGRVRAAASCSTGCGELQNGNG
jgi:glycosyltransferase involved in cell wall biosynthesis